jgi:hypothetical protein
MKKVNLKVRVAAAQRNALNREAKRRGVTASQLMREQIATLTGEPDPYAKGRRRNGTRAKRRGKK